MSDEEEDGFEVMAATLAKGGSVGFGGENDDPDWIAPVMLRQEGDAFIAKRIDGSTLGVFASLGAALDAIEDELVDDEA